MRDLISRQAAIRWVKTECNPYGKPTLEFESGKKVIEHLEQMPSAQPETAKRIVGKSRDGMTLWYQCDMCNEPVDVQDSFCRGCGRRLIDERSNRQTGGNQCNKLRHHYNRQTERRTGGSNNREIC